VLDLYYAPFVWSKRRKTPPGSKRSREPPKHQDQVLPSVLRILSRALAFYAHQWAADHVQDEPDDAPKRELGEIQGSEDVESSRSIFEDVDT
jgi:hypothetical protein